MLIFIINFKVSHQILYEVLKGVSMCTDVPVIYNEFKKLIYLQ
jgi:hypothetical protein